MAYISTQHTDGSNNTKVVASLFLEMMRLPLFAVFISIVVTAKAQTDEGTLISSALSAENSATASPNASPVISPASVNPSVTERITCEIKDQEGGIYCDDDEFVVIGKECCRYYDECEDNLMKCQNKNCCAKISSTSITNSVPSVLPSHLTSTDVITCDIKEMESGLDCDHEEFVIIGKMCCRYDGECYNDLEKCTPSNCCEKSNNPQLTQFNWDTITCEIKDKESSIRCDDLHDNKVCCRYTSNGENCEEGLSKCTESTCCMSTATPKPKPSPSSKPRNEGGYEPVDQFINCAVKAYESGFICSSSEEVNSEKECCRWAGDCGSLSKCTEEHCCTESTSVPVSTPSKTPQPENFTIRCRERNRITSSSRYEMDADKNCCKYSGECGSLNSCLSSFCSNAKSAPPVDTEGVCDCTGAILKGSCYSTLQLAVDMASNKDIIYIGGESVVSSPIKFTKDLTFSGFFCDDIRASIKATFDSVSGAILEAINPVSQNITIEHLAITSSKNMSAAAFHSLGSETSAGDQRVNLTMINVWIHDMYSQRPGVGVFVGQSSGLFVDEDCVFSNLRMETSEKYMYAGGAAIAVIYIPAGHEMKIGGKFTNNSAFYPQASLHSSGGAVYLDYMEGDVWFNAQFKNNTANQGGAVHVQGVFGNMYVDGLFANNHAIDDGYGSRSGAFRVLEIASPGFLLFNGSFIGNTAHGRGGVVATNMMREGSTMILNGFFQNNVASTVGGVWSFWSQGTELMGKVYITANSVFEGNQAIHDSSRSSIYNIAGTSDKLSETEWIGKTITLN
eukprot:CFRG2641T1